MPLRQYKLTDERRVTPLGSTTKSQVLLETAVYFNLVLRSSQELSFTLAKAMEQTRSLTLMFVILFLAVCSPMTQGKLFALRDKETSKPCILVDAHFVLDLAAVRDDKIVAKTQVSSDDGGIRVKGSCGDLSGVLDLFHPNGVNWVLEFHQDRNKQVYLNRTLQFIPNKVFGQAVPLNQYQLMDERRVTPLGNTTKSYECQVTRIVNYQPKTVTTTKSNFRASAHIFHFHAQAFNVYNGSFSPAVLCKAARVTPLTPEVFTTTTQALNTGASPTPKPGPSQPPVNLYTATDGNITCIALRAALTLKIVYYDEDDRLWKVAKLFVPEDATSSGNCKRSATSQELSISFFEHWYLTFIFSTTQKNLLEALTPSTTNDKNRNPPEYRMTSITLTGVVDKEKFPGTGALWPPGTEFVFTGSASDFPEVPSNKNYFKCESSADTVLTSDAAIEHQKLEVKAFNTDNSADFSGPAARCAADSNGPSNKSFTGVVVGCVLAVFVVLSVIVFVMWRIRRRRRQNYQNIQ